MSEQVNVYKHSGEQVAVPQLPVGTVATFWRPSLGALVPPLEPPLRMLIWLAFDRLGLFKDGQLQALILSVDGHAAHCSVVFPAYFAFPFMNKADLQIGLTFTDPAYRGRGLASLAIGNIISRLGQTDRAFWYLAAAENDASCRAAEHGGLSLVGQARHRRRFGLRVLGSGNLVLAPSSAYA